MNQQPRKRGSSPETGRMERQRREIRPTFQARVTKALTVAWAACHSRLSSPDFISFLSPASFSCSSLCGFSTHQILDTLSHEDISWLGNSSPDICMFHCLSSSKALSQGHLFAGLSTPLFYQVLLCTKYCFLT